MGTADSRLAHARHLDPRGVQVESDRLPAAEAATSSAGEEHGPEECVFAPLPVAAGLPARYTASHCLYRLGGYYHSFCLESVRRGYGQFVVQRIATATNLNNLAPAQ